MSAFRTVTRQVGHSIKTIASFAILPGMMAFASAFTLGTGYLYGLPDASSRLKTVHDTMRTLYQENAQHLTSKNAFVFELKKGLIFAPRGYALEATPQPDGRVALELHICSCAVTAQPFVSRDYRWISKKFDYSMTVPAEPTAPPDQPQLRVSSRRLHHAA